MNRLTLIAPDGTRHELTPNKPQHDLALNRATKDAAFVDVYEVPPGAASDDPGKVWVAQVPTTWGIFNGDV